MKLLDNLKTLYKKATGALSGIFGSNVIEIENTRNQENDEDEPIRRSIRDAIGQYETQEFNATPDKAYKFSQNAPLPRSPSNRALGRYQVTTDELKTYGQRYLGRIPSEQEFLNDPKLQDRYMDAKLKDQRRQGAKNDDLIVNHRGGINAKVEERQGYLNAVKKYIPEHIINTTSAEEPEEDKKRVEYKETNLAVETFKNFFSVDTTKETLKSFVIPALQSIPRSVLTVALSTKPGELLGQDKEIRPGEDFGDLGEKLLGKDPIRPLKQTGSDFLKNFGVGEGSADKYGLPIGIALAAADLFPSLKGGKSLSILAKSTDALEIFNILKTESKLSDNILKPLAEQIAKISDPDKIATLLAEKSIDLVKSGSLLSSGLVQRSTTLKESFKQGISNALRRDEYERAFEKFAVEATDSTGNKSGVFKRFFSPMKTLGEKTQDIFQRWDRKIKVGKQLATESLLDVPSIPNKDGLKTITDYESGRYTPFSDALKETFDSLYKEGTERGLNIEYRENYLPQVYKNSREEVMNAMSKYMGDQGVDPQTIKEYLSGTKDLPIEVSKRLGLNPFFTKERHFPSYDVAMQYGLTPKYTNPAQLVSYYRHQMEKTIANRDLIDELAFNGNILPVELAPIDWEVLPSSFSPQGYKAPPELAEMINGIFKNQDNINLIEQGFKTVAWMSKKGQEIALSAGVPKTTVNFFAIGQLVKEMTSGNFKALVPFVRANFNTKSINYFRNNQDVMKRMAEQGLDLGGTIAGYDKVYDNVATNLKLTTKMREWTGNTFDKLFNEKTFGSFMPQMYIQTFKDVEAKAIAKGLESTDAAKFAGHVVKNAFGMIDNLGRSQLAEDALSAVFFAPKFREGVIRTLSNTAKSVTSEIANPAFYKNRRLLGGMAITYGLYNALNYKLNGNYMWDNEDGKEFDLRIPLPNGDVTYLGFMPSFLAFARNMASGSIALATGDFDLATQKLGSLFSIPLKLGSEVKANKDYFGRQIYDPEDSGFDQAKEIAKYVGLQVNHPFIKELIKQLTTDKPLYQSISEAMELPFKFKTQDQLETDKYYDAIDKHKEDRKKAMDKVKPKYDNIQKLNDAGQEDEARALLEELSDEEYELYKDIKATDKRKVTNKLKIEVYPVYTRVQELVAEGKDEEAQAIVDGLTDEEYRVYKLLKEQGLD